MSMASRVTWVPGVPLIQAEGHEDSVVLEVGLVPETGHQDAVVHLDKVRVDAHDVPPLAPAAELPAEGLGLAPGGSLVVRMGLESRVFPSGAHQADEPPLVFSLAESDDHRLVNPLLPHGACGDGGDVGPVLAHVGGAEQQRPELLHAGPVLAGRVVLLEDAVDSGQEVAVGHLQNGPVPEDPG